MKLEFLSEDFDHRKHPDLNGLYLADACALVANQKLERYLKEHGRVVYSEATNFPWHNVSFQACQYQAILINIEEIKKECEHKNNLMEVSFRKVNSAYGSEEVTARCNDCGAKLKANWEAVE